MTRRGGLYRAILATSAVLLGLPSFGWPANTLDEGILLVYPLRMMDGAVPYRDFFAAYGPAHWWLLEGWYRLTAATVAAERTLGLLVHVALVLGVYAVLARRQAEQALVGGLVAAVLLFRPGDSPYAWLIGAALCLWQIALLQRTTRHGALAAGLLGGLALSVRPDMALLALLPAWPLLAGRARRDLLGWAGGLGTGLLPLAVGFLMAPSQLLDDIVLGRAGRGARQSRLPIPPVASGDRVFMTVLGVSLLVILIATLVGTRSRLSTALALLAGASIPQALQRADQVHFVYAAVVILPWLPTTCAHLLMTARRARRPHVLGPLVAVALILLGTGTGVVQPLLITLAGDGPESRPVRHDGRYTPELPPRAAALHKLLPYLDTHTTPGETLFVFDEDLVRPMITDVGLYYLMPRLRQRAHNLEITPGVTAGRGSGLVDDLRSADVVVLVTASPEFRAALFPYEKDGLHDAAELLRTRFCPIAHIDYYRVYRRC